MLRLQCLEWDTPDEPVLVHDQPKVKRTDRRLPITTATAAITTAQRARLRERFPDTPPGKLPLFPRTGRNPDGARPSRVSGWASSCAAGPTRCRRCWTPDGNEFDRRRVFSYAFRHTFAQRHADAGTPVEVLADLLGDDDLKSTQQYYDVSDQRKRLAIDQLRPLQLDRGGDETPFVERLVESQRQRQRVGQVAVTFGGWAEPSNLRASGHACRSATAASGVSTSAPTRPTYPSSRRTSTSCSPTANASPSRRPSSPSGRRDARPPEEEIAAVQRLVRRCEAKLAELPESERDAVEEAIVVLRRARAQLTGRAAPGGQPLAIRQVKPTLNPRVAAEGASR